MELNKDQQKLQSEIREFVEEAIIPYAVDFDLKGKVPRETIDRLIQKGYLGSMIPKEFGGSNFDSVSIGILNEEIGKACTSVRSLLTVHGMVALAIVKWGSKEQKKYWLPKMVDGEIIGAFGLTEPNVGSDAKSIETKAQFSSDCYVINGKKKWITFGQIANLFLIFAQVEGKPTAFLVPSDTAGFSVLPISNTLGVRASMIAEIHMEECRIPKENLVGTEGAGLTYVALKSLDYGRFTIAWGCIGMAQACLDDCLSYARKRKQFGAPLRQHQLIQRMVTEMIVDVKAARLLCHNAALMRDAYDPDSIMETWNAKYFAAKMTNRVTDNAVQIHGANGCIAQNRVERFFRDSKIMEIIEGTNEMHEILIATNAFRNG